MSKWFSSKMSALCQFSFSFSCFCFFYAQLSSDYIRKFFHFFVRWQFVRIIFRDFKRLLNYLSREIYLFFLSFVIFDVTQKLGLFIDLNHSFMCAFASFFFPFLCSQYKQIIGKKCIGDTGKAMTITLTEPEVECAHLQMTSIIFNYVN